MLAELLVRPKVCGDCGGTGVIPLGPGIVEYDAVEVGEYFWPMVEELAHVGVRSCGCGAPRSVSDDHIGNGHKLTLLVGLSGSAWVDEGIAADVWKLWENGIRTDYSCQGDSNSWRYISLVDPNDAIAASSLLSDWVVAVENGAVYGARPSSIHNS